jgi:hypothetical protein
MLRAIALLIWHIILFASQLVCSHVLLKISLITNYAGKEGDGATFPDSLLLQLPCNMYQVANPFVAIQ